MTESVFVGIISASAAILGSSVGLFAQIINNKHERKVRRNDQNTKTYQEFVNAMQLFMNNGDSAGFVEFQKAINTILITAGQSVATEVNSYYQDLVESFNSSKALPPEKHAHYQQLIINKMRRDLGTYEDKLENVRLVAYRS